MKTKKSPPKEKTADLVQDFDQFKKATSQDQGGPTGEKQEFVVDGNRAQAVVVSRTPKTTDEVLAQCGVNTAEWRVEYMKVKSWEVGMSPRSVGRTGDWRRDSANPLVVQLFGYHLTLAKRKPEAVLYPEVQPIIFSLPKQAQKHKAVHQGSSKRQLRRAVIIPDIQCGFRRDHRSGELESFHDRRAMSIAWDITKHIQPDHIILLGDNLDIPEASDKFVRSPEFYFTTQAAATELGWWLTKLRSENPHARISYIEGNHDRRFLLSIINHNIFAYDLRAYDDLEGPALMSVERLLGLKGLNIEYHGPYPTGEVWINENLVAIHGDTVRAKSGATVRAVAEDLRHSLVQGHVHRVEMCAKTLFTKNGPKVYIALSAGTLAKLNPGVVPASIFKNNWQNGFVVCDYEDGNGFFDLHPLYIYDDICIYDRVRWVARTELSIIEDIEASLKGQVKIR